MNRSENLEGYLRRIINKPDLIVTTSTNQDEKQTSTILLPFYSMD
ncbi:MAG: hypothetical protein AB1775_02410 [Bacteroidota bacterium]